MGGKNKWGRPAKQNEWKEIKRFREEEGKRCWRWKNAAEQKPKGEEIRVSYKKTESYKRLCVRDRRESIQKAERESPWQSFPESKSQVTPVSSNCRNKAEGSETHNTLLWKKHREGGRHEATTPALDAFSMYLCMYSSSWGAHIIIYSTGEVDEGGMHSLTPQSSTRHLI